MEAAIIEKLLATSGVTNLVGQRIYPGRRLQASALPSLVLTRVAGNPIYTDDGESGLASGLVQVDCWGATYGAAKGLASAVKSALSAFVGTVGTVTFQYILIDGERDFNEQGSNNAEYLHRVSLDFSVWFET